MRASSGMGMRLMVAVGIVFALILLGFYTQESGTLATLSPEPVRAPRSVPVVAAPVRAVVVAVEGNVERRSPTGGGWLRSRPGDVLTPDESVRTGPGASAVLAVGKDARVEVEEESQFALAEVSSTLARVRLQGGTLQARIKGGNNRRLRVEVEGSDAVAEAGDAEFALMRSADAQVTIASEQGEVSVTAAGKEVRVQGGEQSVVPSGQGPSEPRRIPASLFLKVARGPARTLRTRETVVSGTTTPGALVRVNETTVSADPDGTFEARVALREGKNPVTVSAQDALGRQEQRKLPPVNVDTRPPPLRSKVVWE